MKQRLLAIALTVCLIVSLMPTALAADGETAAGVSCTDTDCAHAAAIGDTHYSSLADAVAAVHADTGENRMSDHTVTLLRDATGGGIPVGYLTFDTSTGTTSGNNPINVTIDLNGHTYTLTSPAVGSAGTETNGFQFLKDSKVTIKDGTIASSDSSTAIYLIQNYCDLTLDGVTLDGTNLKEGDPGTYTLSNNCGSTTIKDSTIIATNAVRHYAFDLSLWDSYQNVSVSVENSTITGNIHLTAYDTTANEKSMKLSIDEDTTVNGMVDISKTNGYFDKLKTFTFSVPDTIQVMGMVAEVSGVCYPTLAQAVDAATAGATVTLLGDVTLTAAVEIDKTLTIDLNGCSITPAEGYTGYDYLIAVKRGGDLTINDTSADKSGRIDSIDKDNVYCAVKLTILGEGETGDPAKLTVNGGTLMGEWYAVFGNGSRHNTEITINGGSFGGYANGSLGIFHPQQGTLTITGGEFTGSSSAVEMRAGTLNISGGTFKSTATTYSCTANSSGSTTVGAAIAIAQHTTKKDISVTISGGTFEGTRAFNEANPQSNETTNVTLSITGGTFTGLVKAEGIASTAKFISGGYFTTNPEDYLADGCYVNPSDKTGYTYMVNTTAPAADEATIFVSANTDASVSSDIGEAGAAITAVIDKTAVTGVDQALNKTAFVNDAQAETGSGDVMVTLTVKVEVTGYTDGTLSFSAKPYAKIGDGTEVEVDNCYLSGNITVKLPLPEGYTPKQIKHTSSDGSVEYFINATEGTKRGAKTFTIEDNCAVFTITKFSTFELTQDVTYTEPAIPSYTPTTKPAEEPEKEFPFTDVDKDSKLYEGIHYAWEKGIMEGYDETTFAPGKALTRGMLVALLYRYEGSPAVSGVSFDDVADGRYYTEAIAWAAANGIVLGNEGKFSPDKAVTRQQLAAILYRYAQYKGIDVSVGEDTNILSYTDALEVAEYAFPAMQWACGAGLIQGFEDGSLRPTAGANRGQAATILMRLIENVL